MRTIIAGSRGVRDITHVRMAMAACGWNPSVVISGGAPGVDRLGEQWARERGVPCEVFPADWNGPLGRAAGKARNEQMADNAHALVAVWDGRSPGTRHMIEAAKLRLLWIYVLKPPR